MNNYYSGRGTMKQLINQSGLFDDNIELNSDDVDTISSRVDEEVNITSKRLKKLEKEQGFIDNNLHFIFAIDDDLHDYQKWCFENDLIFMVKELILLGDDYQALVFKNVEDAMAFKLGYE